MYAIRSYYVVLDAKGHGTSVSAVTADRIDLLELPGTRLELDRARQDGTDRAHGNALAAELAVEAAVVSGGDLGLETAVDEGVGAVADHLVADPHALAAEHAAVHVALDQRIDLILRQVELLAFEAVAHHLVLVGQVV